MRRGQVSMAGVSRFQDWEASRRVVTVILHYGRIDDTMEAVRSVFGSTLPSTLVVVDNAGDALALRQNLADFREGTVEVVETPCNLGFAAGVNLGIERACKRAADYFFLLNNDAVVEANTLEALVQAAETHPEAGILSPVVYFMAERSRVWSAGVERRGLFGFRRNVTALLPRVRSSDVIPVDVVAGCAMLLKRRLVESIGLFDARLFMYYEDVEYCTRAWKAGFCVLTVLDARAYHRVNAEAEDECADLDRLYRRARGKATYYTLEYSRRGKLAALVRLAVGVLAFGGRCILARDRRIFGKYLRATIDGWRDARGG